MAYKQRLTATRLAAADLDMLPVYEEIIRTGAWWDFALSPLSRTEALRRITAGTPRP